MQATDIFIQDFLCPWNVCGDLFQREQCLCSKCLQSSEETDKYNQGSYMRKTDINMGYWGNTQEDDLTQNIEMSRLKDKTGLYQLSVTE